VKIEMAKQKAQLGARGLHGLVESRPDGGRNQEQKTKNHSLGPNTSDEENYQIRKMKTQRTSYLRSEGKTQPRRGHTSASHRSRSSPRENNHHKNTMPKRDFY
jgi:hypothetical protein